MKYVYTENLQPGMMSVRTLWDKNGIKLLSANKELNETLINRLVTNGYKGIFIFDEYSQYEQTSEILTEEERIKAVNSLENLELDKVLFFANEIVNRISKNKDMVIELKDLQNVHNSTYEHCINVAQLAVPCGIGMGLNDKQLESLAAGAMLHDIGKMAIPMRILDKPGKLTPKEYNIIKQHPRLGYNMIYDKPIIKSEARAGILLHHENEDGTGYPLGLSGNKIPIVAKIIHVADVYEALCQKRCYKEKYSFADSLEYLMGGCGTMFNFSVVSAFSKYITIYPVGMDVTLSNGQEARVIKNHVGNTLRPIVITKDTKEILDLTNDTTTYNVTILQGLQ